MAESFKKNATVDSTPRPQLTAENVSINRNGRPVSIPTAISGPNGLPNRTSDSTDAEIPKWKFAWHMIGPHFVPYITCIMNSEQLKFVSVRMAETQLLSNYLHYLHADIYTSCTSVKSHFITDSQAKLLNVINFNHCEKLFGKDKFVAGKDCIVRLEDVHEFYLFIEVCYKRLKSNFTPGLNEKCGFVRINSESVVPYCIKDDKKYVPLFYFEGETDDLKHQAIKLENWNLAYLKFCCMVHGIRNELFASDSCLAISLDDIKSFFQPDTNFEDYWPVKVVDKELLTNQKLNHVNPPGSWIQTPENLGLNKANNVQHPPLPPPAAVPPPGMPMSMNGWPSNQLAFFQNSAMLQQSNSNNNQLNIQPPPLVRSGGIATTQIISSHAPYPNVTVASINQSMTTVYNNSVANDNVMSQSHHSMVPQYFSGQQQQQRPMNGGGGQFQQQQLQQQQQQQSYGQPMMNVGGTVVSNPRIGHTQQRNALRTTVTAPASGIIDLSSPPSSPGPSAVAPPMPAEMVNRGPVSWELQRVPERPWQPEASHSVAYKIQKATLQDKMIHCINFESFNYSDLLITLDDLVQTVFPTVTVEWCIHVFIKYLNVTLYRGNPDQVAVLRENNRIRSAYSDDTPMVMLKDVTHVLLQLKRLVHKQDDQIQQFSVGTPAKRQRISKEWAGHSGSQ